MKRSWLSTKYITTKKFRSPPLDLPSPSLPPPPLFIAIRGGGGGGGGGGMLHAQYLNGTFISFLYIIHSLSY